MDELATQRRKTHEAGKNLLIAKSAFNREMIRLTNLTPPCDDATGFRLLALFRLEVQTYVFDYKRGGDPGLKHAANEMYRLIAVEEAAYTQEQMDGFVKWYERLKHRIGRAIGDLFDYHGDGFGDLCDSLPLAGEEVVRRCLATGQTPKRAGFLEEAEIEPAVRDAAGPEWAKFICQGENYVAKALQDQARHWFLHALLCSEFLTPEEQQAVDYACHYDD